MKAKKAEVTTADALCLLHVGGMAAPSPERVAITLCVQEYCLENDVAFTNWNQPLYPELRYDDNELIVTLEEACAVSIDDKDYENDQMKTFGDLINLFEGTVALNENRKANERAKLADAACATQAAFYLIRRRLCETGAAYHLVHEIRPCLPLLDVPIKQAELLAEGISKDHGLAIPLRRVL